MPNKFERLQSLLAELFQLDRADLDFGIYRIMNLRREEITRFLREELLPQVRTALAGYQPAERAELETELRQAEGNARALGMDPAGVPMMKQLRERLAAYGLDVGALEDEVYSHLYDFFRRYYDEGDFISVRRYREGVYAIPYEGEEVKLHWANADQYYVKTSENFRDYTFRLPTGRRVHFKLAEAEADRDNVKAAEGKDRRFILVDTAPVAVEGDELLIRFEYRADPEKRKQAELNGLAAAAILAAAPDGWIAELRIPAPTEANPRRTLLDKHLADYTARNTFDYFIHKDLRGFLRRELDFYIKNEVVRLDDIESETAPRAEAYLGKVRALRQVAHKIIDFLAQIEEFQKRLWLKKKFVVETNYCVTLDRVPKELYGEIAANDAQREEWVRLFAIDEIVESTVTPPYSVPLTADFLNANPFLVLDTRFFDLPFRDRLLSSFDELEDEIDGLLFHADNFHALNLLLTTYRGRISSIYIDPPYNTSDEAFVYKNNYKHSSWISMMRSRLPLAKALLPSDGVLQVAIDDTETNCLRIILDDLFGATNYVATIAVEVNPAGQNLRPNAPARSHDYFHIYARDIEKAALLLRGLTPEEEELYRQRDEKGYYLWDNLRRRGGNSRPSDRPKQWFPLYADFAKGTVSADPFSGAEEVWPIDPKGEKRIWRVNREGARREIAAGEVSIIRKADRWEIVKKSRMPEGKKPKTLWADPQFSATTYGTKLLGTMVDVTSFSYPKSLNLVQECLRYWTRRDAIVLDFFAGSGTTGHAVIRLNEEDEGSRKYILAEVGTYFDTVLKPRMQKIVYSKDWKDRKPVSREGVSHLFKYLRLESYEDTLNNLAFRPHEGGQLALAQHPEFREDYTLHYMLDAESRDSLLNVRVFEDPFGYTLNIATGVVGEARPVSVDLVETFNYLLGLKVRHVDAVQGYRVVQGTNPQGERVLVIWRNLKEAARSNADLETFFRKQDYNPRDMEFDLIYVNGDNHLENLRRPDETWKVRLIEEEFMRLMFDTQDV